MNPIPAMREWYEQNVMSPAAEADAKRREEQAARHKALVKLPIVYEPITPDEEAAIAALGKCTFCPGTGVKRFARDMKGSKQLSQRQRQFLWSSVWRFRRQIKDMTLLELAAKRMEASQC